MKDPLFADIKFWIVLILSTLAGMTIAWIDSQPGWDSTGITAVVLFVTAFAAGVLSPKRWWLWALTTGIWIPAAGLMRTGDVMMLLVLLFTFGGAFSGELVSKIFRKDGYR
jgi:hypothetical protein